MTVISNYNIALAIYGATKGKTPAEQSDIFPKIVEFLVRKNLLSKSKDILTSLNKIINEKEGNILAKVWSVEKINEATKKEITHNLSKRYEGKKIILEENIDKNLIGGYKIEVNDEVLDLTLKNRIEKLQTFLTRSV